MKKALIFIAVISLLLTLFIPNTAYAQECYYNQKISIKPGCDWETTTITIEVSGWSEGPISELSIAFNLLDEYTGISLIREFFDYTVLDPFKKSYSLKLPTRNFRVSLSSGPFEGSICVDEKYFTIEKCLEPTTAEPTPALCYCSLVVLKRGETGNPINGAVFEVDGVEKITKDGKARWDNLECDTTYEVKEISPNEQIEGIHLGNCGERSTITIVNKIEEEVTEETTIEDDYSKPILRMGSRGYWVVELQKMLNFAVYRNTNDLVLDGAFGPKTNHAVVYFQSSCNITVDGIVGPQTWGLLNSVCNQ